MVRYYISCVAGILALFLWLRFKLGLVTLKIPDDYLFWYWFAGAGLIAALVSVLIMTKRVAGWSFLEFVLFIWTTVLGIIVFCAAVLRMEVF